MYTARWGSFGDVTTDPAALFQELHATALAIAQARARGDTVDLAALQQHFDAVRAAFLAAGQAADAPTYWQGVAARIGDAQDAVAAVVQGAADVAQAAKAGLQATGYLLPVGLGLLAAFYLWPLRPRRAA